MNKNLKIVVGAASVAFACAMGARGSGPLPKPEGNLFEAYVQTKQEKQPIRAFLQVFERSKTQSQILFDENQKALDRMKKAFVHEHSSSSDEEQKDRPTLACILNKRDVDRMEQEMNTMRGMVTQLQDLVAMMAGELGALYEKNDEDIVKRLERIEKKISEDEASQDIVQRLENIQNVLGNRSADSGITKLLNEIFIMMKRVYNFGQ